MVEYLELFVYVPFIFFITFWLFKFYRRCSCLCLPGWKTVFGGLTFLFLASLLDISDQFPEFQNQFLVQYGLHVPMESFRYVPEVIGLSGVLFLLLVVYRWLPSLAWRLEQQEKIASNEERLCAMLSSSIDAVITMNQYCKIVTVNPAVTKLFGYEGEELLGKNINILMPEPHHSNHDQYIKNYNETGEIHIIGRGLEVEAKRKDGSIFPIDLTVTELNTSQGKQFTGTMRDITARKQSEQAHITAKKRAEDLTRSKSEFLANMSHEIRTPMSGVLGMLELLQSSRLDKKQLNFVETARNSAEMLLTVINDILDFSKVEADKLTLENIEFDLFRTVEDSTTLFARSASAKNLELNCFISPDIPKILCGDPVRLRQVLNNLISNAVKFTGQGEIDVNVISLGKTADNEGITLEFEVKDTGEGILKESQSGLFDVFTQEDGSTTKKFGGTGLGLSISKQLVLLMGGAISLESQKGQGATFTFTANFAVAKGQTLRRSTLPPNLKILAVDDNETNVNILAHYFDSWSINNSCVDSGVMALEKLRKAEAAGNPFDVVVLDQHMPGMSGIQLMEAIKKDETLSQPRLIMLSSVDALFEEDRIGIDRYLVKPPRQSDLYNALMQMTEAHECWEQAPSDEVFVDAASVSRLAGKNILIVDDMPTNRIVVTEMLRDVGVHTDTASNGQEAVDAVVEKSYDLVLMDCQMPLMDGFEATEVIRSMEKAQGIMPMPVVALTAYAMKGDKEECLYAGMNDYLTKPFIREDLLNTLLRWIPCGEEDNVLDHANGVSTTIQQDSEIPDSEIQGSEIQDSEIQGSEIQDSDKNGSDILLDEKQLLELKDLTGESFESIIDLFEKDARKVLNDLIKAIDHHNIDEIIQATHTMKGMSLNMAATALSQQCLELEMQAKVGQVEDAQGVGEQLMDLCERTFDSLRGS